MNAETNLFRQKVNPDAFEWQNRRLGVPMLVFGLFRSVQVLLASVLTSVGMVIEGHD